MIVATLFVAFVVGLCGLAVVLGVCAGERIAQGDGLQAACDAAIGLLVAVLAVVVVRVAL